MPDSLIGALVWSGGGILATAGVVYQFLRLRHDRRELALKMEEARRREEEKAAVKLVLPTPEEVREYGKPPPERGVFEVEGKGPAPSWLENPPPLLRWVYIVLLSLLLALSVSVVLYTLL